MDVGNSVGEKIATFVRDWGYLRYHYLFFPLWCAGGLPAFALTASFFAVSSSSVVPLLLALFSCFLFFFCAGVSLSGILTNSFFALFLFFGMLKYVEWRWMH